MICDRCGAELRIGDFPFCKGDPSAHGPYGVRVIDDQLEGGARFFETLGHDPVWIESKSQWRRELAARPHLIHADSHDRDYHNRKFRMHDEELKDTRKDRDAESSR